MGFLDHSTNNIIIDAALTDLGRKFLARNDGSFSIIKFALADDEVDYSIIKKFGRQVGREKIAKNTIVLEAQTSAELGLKFKVLSNSNAVLTRLSKFQITSLNTDASFLSMTKGQVSGNNFKTVTVEQTISVGLVDTEFVDNSFTVIMNDRFLTIPDKTKIAVTATNTATYMLGRDAQKTASGGGKLIFTVSTRSLTDETFNIFGNYGNKAMISTIITIVGLQSGAVKNINVQISKT